MNDSRKIKTLVFGMMDGSNREWSDDIEQWCGTTLQELSHDALDRQRWAAIARMASDTNGHWAHGCRWWWWWWWLRLRKLLESFCFRQIRQEELTRRVNASFVNVDLKQCCCSVHRDPDVALWRTCNGRILDLSSRGFGFEFRSGRYRAFTTWMGDSADR